MHVRKKPKDSIEDSLDCPFFVKCRHNEAQFVVIHGEGPRNTLNGAKNRIKDSEGDLLIQYLRFLLALFRVFRGRSLSWCWRNVQIQVWGNGRNSQANLVEIRSR